MRDWGRRGWSWGWGVRVRLSWFSSFIFFLHGKIGQLMWNKNQRKKEVRWSEGGTRKLPRPLSPQLPYTPVSHLFLCLHYTCQMFRFSAFFQYTFTKSSVIPYFYHLTSRICLSACLYVSLFRFLFLSFPRWRQSITQTELPHHSTFRSFRLCPQWKSGPKMNLVFEFPKGYIVSLFSGSRWGCGLQEGVAKR